MAVIGFVHPKPDEIAFLLERDEGPQAANALLPGGNGVAKRVQVVF
jgi:hypothetical protein